MRRIKVPTPPSHNSSMHNVIQDGITACHLWAFDDKGLAAIETQYGNCQAIQDQLGVSRATAYRIINRHHKRYWLTDYRDADHPKVYSVLPKSVVEQVTVYPVGNPNFHSGIYQQGIARRPRMKRR